MAQSEKHLLHKPEKDLSASPMGKASVAECTCNPSWGGRAWRPPGTPGPVSLAKSVKDHFLEIRWRTTEEDT